MVSVRLQSKSKKYESITVWWGEDKNATVNLIQEDRGIEPTDIIVPFVELV